MSQSDSFISEVADEVRRDRMFRLWRRYGAYVIAAIFVVVVGGAVNAWWSRSQEDQSREQMEQLLAAIDEDNPEETAQALDELVDEAAGGYEVLVRFQAAAAHLEAGDYERAGVLYREVAAQDGLKPWFTELAELKAVLAEAEAASPEELVTALRPQTLDGRIYRLVAQELLAGALVAAGEDDEAMELIEEVLENPDLGGSAQRRLGDLRDVLEARAEPEMDDDAASDDDATTSEDDTMDDSADSAAADGEAASDADADSTMEVDGDADAGGTQLVEEAEMDEAAADGSDGEQPVADTETSDGSTAEPASDESSDAAPTSDSDAGTADAGDSPSDESTSGE